MANPWVEGRRRGRPWRLPLSVLPPLLLLLLPLLGGAGLGRAAAPEEGQQQPQPLQPGKEQEQEKKGKDGEYHGGVDPAYFEETGAWASMLRDRITYTTGVSLPACINKSIDQPTSTG